MSSSFTENQFDLRPLVPSEPKPAFPALSGAKIKRERNVFIQTLLSVEKKKMHRIERKYNHAKEPKKHDSNRFWENVTEMHSYFFVQLFSLLIDDSLELDCAN